MEQPNSWPNADGNNALNTYSNITMMQVIHKNDRDLNVAIEDNIQPMNKFIGYWRRRSQ